VKRCHPAIFVEVQDRSATTGAGVNFDQSSSAAHFLPAGSRTMQVAAGKDKVDGAIVIKIVLIAP